MWSIRHLTNTLYKVLLFINICLSCHQFLCYNPSINTTSILFINISANALTLIEYTNPKGLTHKGVLCKCCSNSEHT